MRPDALSLSEALLLCQETQYLVGSPMNPQLHAHGDIERVVVVPYNAEKQRAYIESLPQRHEDILTPEQIRDGFAVVAVAKPRRWLEQSVLFQDVRRYLAQVRIAMRDRDTSRALTQSMPRGGASM